MGIDPDRRPQSLAVGEWLALREALGPIGPDGRGRRAALQAAADADDAADVDAARDAGDSDAL